uniref:Uncharacterized protein n=1 Tax=Plectus sambesii TaxID=2011161 RepID=A0A914WRA6_9BILA
MNCGTKRHRLPERAGHKGSATFRNGQPRASLKRLWRCNTAGTEPPSVLNHRVTRHCHKVMRWPPGRQGARRCRLCRGPLGRERERETSPDGDPLTRSLCTRRLAAHTDDDQRHERQGRRSLIGS